MRHDNDYTCIVFFEDGSAKKWRKIYKLSRFASFLNQKHQGWKYFNVYDRKSNKYLRRFYKGNFIPHFLPLLFPLIILIHTLTFSIAHSSNYAKLNTLNSTFSNTLRAEQTFTNGFNNTATISTPNPKGGVL